MITAPAAFVVAVSPACNPAVAISSDAANLGGLRDELGRAPTLTAIAAVSVKGRLAIVKDMATPGADLSGRWTKSPGPAAALETLWSAVYTKNSPRDPLRSFTFVEVLNAQGQHLITLTPPPCLSANR